jgi:hypothetical protein
MLPRHNPGELGCWPEAAFRYPQILMLQIPSVPSWQFCTWAAFRAMSDVGTRESARTSDGPDLDGCHLDER